MLRKTYLAIFLGLMAIGIWSCSAGAEADTIDITDINSTSYRGEFIDGDPQRRSYTFVGLEGSVKELLTVDVANQLEVRLELSSGEIEITLLDPDGNTMLTANPTPGTPDTIKISGPLASGTYTLLMEASNANGRVKLSFLK